MEVDCPVCCEEYNKSTRKSTKCPKCQFEVCRSCVVEYIKSNNHQEVSCMNCKKPLGRGVLSGFMTKKYMAEDYRDHREAVLFEQERAKIPDVMPYAEAVSRRRKYRRRLSELKNELALMRRRVRRLEWRISRETDFISFVPGSLDPGEYNPDVEYGVESDTQNSTPEPVDYTSRGHCPKSECNGLIGKGWACCSCETVVCKSCLVEIEMTQDGKPDHKSHSCTPSDLETVAAIRKDCKPCPNCRIRVFKIEGCSAMWCTSCHTMFDWRDLSILRGAYFHNPHYAEWVASRQTVGGNVNRGGCVDHGAIVNWLARHTSVAGSIKRNQIYTTLSRILNQANYETDRNRRFADPAIHEQTLMTLRIDFITGLMDRDQYKLTLQRLDKKHSKTLEISQIRDMYGNATRDILTELTSQQYTSPTGDNSLDAGVRFYVDQITELRAYSNRSLADVQRFYGKTTLSYTDQIHNPETVG